MIMPTQLKLAILTAAFCAFSAWQCRCCTRSTNRSVANFWHLAFGASFVVTVIAGVWWACL